jgi:hypothetical protein
MSDYKLNGNGVTRTRDIPIDTGNRDWIEYLKWVSDGNAALPDDPVPTPPDLSDTNNLDKLIKAAVLAAAAMAGKTPGQARAAFKTAWDSLP